MRGLACIPPRASWVAFAFALAMLCAPTLLSAQGGEFEAVCDAPEIALASARDACLATAQAVASAQPLVGILIAGGNPTIGSSGASGFRLGILPRVSAGVRLNVVEVDLPDILGSQFSENLGSIAEQLGVTAPAVSGDVSVGIFDGISIGPGLGGVGGLSLLGSLSYLPLDLVDADGFEQPDLAYGLGARLHLLEESFFVPGISLSVMRHALPSLEFGDICPGGLTSVPIPESDPPREASACTGEGDTGEFSFDLTNWSGRLVASKHFLGLGATAGVGYDRYDSEIGFGFRAPSPVPGTAITPAFRATGLDRDNTRWTAFGNLSFSFLVASIAAEAGWQQGDAPIRGFEEVGGDFDPNDGTWYGSIGARLSL